MNAGPTLLREVAPLRAHVAALREAGRPVVLVPTMGDLHDGHLRLASVGREIGEVVVSVFVNPTQFGPHEDFERYPRRLESDCEKLATVGANAVFAPEVDTMYPPGDRTWVEVREISEPLCGQYREGHFLGVTTVCTKLFTLVRPDAAVFGQKDAQQCLVLHRLVRDLHLDVDLVFVPTVRERDGLAMSSRNRYLEGEERELALRLRETLHAGQACLEAGERDRRTVEARMREALDRPPVRIDYAELRTVPALAHPERAEGRVLLAVAAHVGRARLIDNRCLQVDGTSVHEVPLLDEHTPEAAVARWRARS